LGVDGQVDQLKSLNFAVTLISGSSSNSFTLIGVVIFSSYSSFGHHDAAISL